MEKLLRTRYKDGVVVSEKEAQIVSEIAEKSKIDAWFGQIIRATTKDGKKKILVVKDNESGRILQFKWAVRVLDEGILSPLDYVGHKEAYIYEKMLKRIGVVNDTGIRWRARFVSDDPRRISNIMGEVIQRDKVSGMMHMMAGIKVFGKRLFYLDLKDDGLYHRSPAFHAVRHDRYGVAWTAIITGLKSYVDVRNGPEEIPMKKGCVRVVSNFGIGDVVCGEKEANLPDPKMMWKELKDGKRMRIHG